MEIQTSDIEVLILAGGLGTRLRSVLGSRQPKALAHVAGRPFLDSLFDKLIAIGLQNVSLSLGHLADEIENHYQAGYKSLRINFISEREPLGTGGAVSYCALQIKAPYLLVMNGDTILDVPLLRMQEAMDPETDGVCLVSKVSDTLRFGRLEMDDKSFVSKIHGAGTKGEGFVYAGVTLMRLEAATSHEARDYPYGFESAILGNMTRSRSLKAVTSESTFLDIGTPESLEAAQKYDV